MIVKIVGVRKHESKGRNVFNIAALKEYAQYEKENAECKGVDVISEFTYTDYGLAVGDVVEFLYEPGFQQRAKLTGVRSVSPTDNPFESKPDKKTDK